MIDFFIQKKRWRSTFQSMRVNGNRSDLHNCWHVASPTRNCLSADCYWRSIQYISQPKVFQNVWYTSSFFDGHPSPDSKPFCVKIGHASISAQSTAVRDWIRRWCFGNLHGVSNLTHFNWNNFHPICPSPTSSNPIKWPMYINVAEFHQKQHYYI